MSGQIRPGEGLQGKQRGGPDEKDGRREPHVGTETAREGRKLGDRQGPGRMAHGDHGQDSDLFSRSNVEPREH